MNKNKHITFTSLVALFGIVLFTVVLMGCPVAAPTPKAKDGGGDDNNNNNIPLTCPTIGNTPKTFTPTGADQAARKASLIAEIDRVIGLGDNSPDLNYIDTSGITNMSRLFYDDAFTNPKYRTFNGDVSQWDTSNVINMQSMFDEAKVFDGDVCSWNVGEVENMEFMFRSAEKFNSILIWEEGADTPKKISQMFTKAKSFEGRGNIGSWDISPTTNMKNMFSDAYKFNADISGWVVNQVTNMQNMFLEAKVFTQDISAWASRLNAGLDKTNMFKGSPLESNPPF